MKEGRISVVMATYNGALYLREQLDSILQQSLLPFEIIVSDDHSTDQTALILDEYQKRGVLKWVLNNRSRGVISNFKMAVSLAESGTYLAFADQDDIWLPDKLRNSLDELKNIERQGTAAMVYSDPEVMNSNGEISAPSLWDILGYSNYSHALSTVLFGNPAGGLTMLINPKLREAMLEMPDNAYMHDAWLTLYAYTFGQVSIVKGPLVRYRQHQDNLTFSISYKAKSRLARILDEVKNSLSNGDKLFKEQFSFVRQFYDFYEPALTPDKKAFYKSFLSLEDASYIAKKIAFRKAMQTARRLNT